MNIQRITGTYGTDKQPTDIFIYTNAVFTAYVIEGDRIIYITFDSVEDGVYVNELRDYDCITSIIPITCEDAFKEFIEELTAYYGYLQQ